MIKRYNYELGEKYAAQSIGLGQSYAEYAPSLGYKLYATKWRGRLVWASGITAIQTLEFFPCAVFPFFIPE